MEFNLPERQSKTKTQTKTQITKSLAPPTFSTWQSIVISRIIIGGYYVVIKFIAHFATLKVEGGGEGEEEARVAARQRGKQVGKLL